MFVPVGNTSWCRITCMTSSYRVTTYSCVPGTWYTGASSRRRRYVGYQSSCVDGSNRLISSIAIVVGHPLSMATILAHIRVKPGTEAQFEAIAARLHTATHATEPGVRHYEFWRGAEHGRYYSLLSFDDFPAFIAHQTSEHHETASPEIGAIVESIRLEWCDPVPGASDLPPTVLSPVADDADDLTRDYAGRFAMQIAAWWPSAP